MKIKIDRETPITNFLQTLGDTFPKIVESTANTSKITEFNTDDILLPNYHGKGEDGISVADVWMRIGAARHLPLDIYCFRTMWENREVLEQRFKDTPQHPNDAIVLMFDGTILHCDDQGLGTATAFMRFNPGSGKFYHGTFFLEHLRGILHRSLVIKNK